MNCQSIKAMVPYIKMKNVLVSDDLNEPITTKSLLRMHKYKHLGEVIKDSAMRRNEYQLIREKRNKFQ
jgi:hypothetical protein